MTQTFDSARSGHVANKIEVACASCKWTASIVLLCTGVLAMALAVDLLGWSAINDWRYGWIAKIIGVVLLCTVPAVLTMIVANYRTRRDVDVLVKRVAWAGISLIVFGVLESILGFAGLYLTWLFAALTNH